MGLDFGALGLSPESASEFVNTLGQRVVFEWVEQYMAELNTAMTAATSVFIEGETEEHKERYFLPGFGGMQEVGPNGRPANVSPFGYVDVAYPLREWGAAIGGNRADRAYMTLEEFNKHLDALEISNAGLMRNQILRALFNNTAYTFSDNRKGDLTIQPLANGDSVVYPPVLGASTEATHSHYLGSNYAASAISDSNDPLTTIIDHLEEHFGTRTGGSPIAIFHNSAQTVRLAALTEFIDYKPFNVTFGANRDQVSDLHPKLQNGSWKVHGTYKGAWICQWAYIPSGYLLGVHLDAPSPLKKRVDLARTGLRRGLQLVAEDMDHPFENSFYSHRFGLGAANRLNGVAMQLVASTTYTTPAVFA